MAGRFVLEHRAGQGAMGEVYRARDQENGATSGHQAHDARRLRPGTGRTRSEGSFAARSSAHRPIHRPRSRRRRTHLPGDGVDRGGDPRRPTRCRSSHGGRDPYAGSAADLRAGGSARARGRAPRHQTAQPHAFGRQNRRTRRGGFRNRSRADWGSPPHPHRSRARNTRLYGARAGSRPDRHRPLRGHLRRGRRALPRADRPARPSPEATCSRF